jgi:hypothetical protein
VSGVCEYGGARHAGQLKERFFRKCLLIPFDLGTEAIHRAAAENKTSLLVVIPFVNPTMSPSSSASPDWTGSTRCFWGMLTVVTLWKFFAATTLGLLFDECYYWAWSLHPQACYFDHPPLTGWLIAAGHLLWGHSTMAVRFWAVVSGIILALAGRSLGESMFGKEAGNRAGILLLLAPIFAGNALLMTPDTFLIPAWACAVLCAWKGSREGANLRWWLGAGAAAGIGMLSKYTMILFYGGLCILWLLRPGHRARLTAGIALAATISFLLFLPVIWWNGTHSWVSFQNQIHHGFHNEHRALINFGNLLDYLTFLIVLVSPILGLLCFRTAFTRTSDERFQFLGIFFWIVVLFFGFSAAKAHIEANWPMAAFVTALVMVAGDWESYALLWRRAALIVLLIADVGAVTGVSYLSLPTDSPVAITKLSPDFSVIHGFPGAGELRRNAAQGFSDFQARIEEFLGPPKAAAATSAVFRKSGADFLCPSTYQFFGVMAFYAPDLEHLLWLPDRGRKRFPWINDRAWAGKNAMVAEWPRSDHQDAPYFEKTTSIQKIELPGIKSPVTVTIYEGYHPEKILP